MGETITIVLYGIVLLKSVVWKIFLTFRIAHVSELGLLGYIFDIYCVVKPYLKEFCFISV